MEADPIAIEYTYDQIALIILSAVSFALFFTQKHSEQFLNFPPPVLYKIFHSIGFAVCALQVVLSIDPYGLYFAQPWPLLANFLLDYSLTSGICFLLVLCYLSIEAVHVHRRLIPRLPSWCLCLCAVSMVSCFVAATAIRLVAWKLDRQWIIGLFWFYMSLALLIALVLLNFAFIFIGRSIKKLPFGHLHGGIDTNGNAALSLKRKEGPKTKGVETEETSSCSEEQLVLRAAMKRLRYRHGAVVIVVIPVAILAFYSGYDIFTGDRHARMTYPDPQHYNFLKGGPIWHYSVFLMLCIILYEAWIPIRCSARTPHQESLLDSSTTTASLNGAYLNESSEYLSSRPSISTHSQKHRDTIYSSRSDRKAMESAYKQLQGEDPNTQTNPNSILTVDSFLNSIDSVVIEGPSMATNFSPSQKTNSDTCSSHIPKESISEQDRIFFKSVDFITIDNARQNIQGSRSI